MSNAVSLNDADDFGGWAIQRESDGSYALYTYERRAAPVRWDSGGRCWVYWESPADCGGIVFNRAAICGEHLDALARLLSIAQKPDDVGARDPEEFQLRPN
jgi:hypothetical protein